MSWQVEYEDGIPVRMRWVEPEPTEPADEDVSVDSTKEERCPVCGCIPGPNAYAMSCDHGCHRPDMKAGSDSKGVS